MSSEILEQYSDINLQTTELSLSLIDLTDLIHAKKPSKRSEDKKSINTKSFSITHFRGEESTYPASIVKLFYLVALQQWLEDKKITETDEVRRASKDMIVDSSNDATAYIVDVLTGTTGGPELPPKEMATWIEKRNMINKYFQKLGYKNININQKTWGDGSYGRERVFVGKDYKNRNKLTTNATAKLLADIATGQCISKKRSDNMLALLSRDFTKASDDVDNQAIGFMGSCLPKGAKLWSKAGWMSTVRHDAAYIKLANGIRFVLVVFISNHAKEYWVLPNIAKKVIHGLESHHGVAHSKLQ